MTDPMRTLGVRLVSLVCMIGALPQAGALRAQAPVPTKGSISQARVQGVVEVRGGRADNIVVLLTPLAAAPSPAPGAPSAAQIDQRGLQFLPPTIAVWPGSVISFPNSDPVLHNIFIVDEARTRTDLGTYPMGEFREITLTAPGAYLVLCHLHPEMVANVLVAAAPYRVVTDSSGRFAFDAIPPGSYRMQTWHRRLPASETKITMTAGETTSARLVINPSKRRTPGLRPANARSNASAGAPTGVRR